MIIENPNVVTRIAADDLQAELAQPFSYPDVFYEGRRRWERRETFHKRQRVMSAYYVAANEPDYPEILHVWSR